MSQLTEREKKILKFVIHDFIETAHPIGSKFVSKLHRLEESPATIRNTMANLECIGLISHPHTSAGRIPTDKGYRYYVDCLMELKKFPKNKQVEIEQQLLSSQDAEEMLRVSSKILGTISNQLSIVLLPKFSKIILERLELVSISSSKLMVVIALQSGFIKTIMIEIRNEISRSYLHILESFLNERLSGLTLEEIRTTFADRVIDMQDEASGLIRIFINSVDTMFDVVKKEKIYLNGTSSIVSQPEFFNGKNFRTVVDLLNNEDMFIHVLEIENKNDKSVNVIIGEENKDKRFSEFSIVTSQYKSGKVNGTIGIIGPKRMNYSKVIPIVKYISNIVSKILS